MGSWGGYCIRYLGLHFGSKKDWNSRYILENYRCFTGSFEPKWINTDIRICSRDTCCRSDCPGLFLLLLLSFAVVCFSHRLYFGLLFLVHQLSVLTPPPPKRDPNQAVAAVAVFLTRGGGFGINWKEARPLGSVKIMGPLPLLRWSNLGSVCIRKGNKRKEEKRDRNLLLLGKDSFVWCCFDVCFCSVTGFF